MQMSRQGLSPVKIDEARMPPPPAKKAAAAAAARRTARRKVPAKAVEAFTRELANLLAGGVSLARSLSLLRREASNPNAKKLWGDIHDDVVGGTALADAMAKFPRTFSSSTSRWSARARRVGFLMSS